MSPAEQNPNPADLVPKSVWITPREWEENPGTCALKLGTAAATITVLGSVAPWVAFGAGLVVVAKAVRS